MELAVAVRGASKSYNKDLVLDELNMQVTKGTIYGLLGASGCGKTTLLSCILGVCSLDQGEIWTLGGKPGSSASGVPGNRIGYMPQVVSLYMDFTVEEILYFFGHIQGLHNSRIKKRMEFLLELFQIKIDGRFINSYSGGQQRRISLIVALLHEPELLLLDEPTVGIDTILRQKVWNHLLQLANEEGKTIIITTLYIEETKRAHSVGLMRSGKLLVEGSPNDLMCLYDVTTLEELFLEAITSNLDIRSNSSELNEKKCKTLSKDASNITRRNFRKYNLFPHVLPMIEKNFQRLFRSKFFLFVVFLLPVITGHSAVFVLGRQINKLPFVIVNNDIEGISCSLPNSCTASNLSCLVLRHLQSRDHFDFTKHSTIESASNAIQKGQAWGVIQFPHNFSQHFMDRIEQGVNSEDMTIESSLISITMDATNVIIRENCYYLIRTSIVDAIEDIYNICNYTVNNPILLKKLGPIYGKHNEGYAPILISGGTMNIQFFIIAIFFSIVLIHERTDGIAHRLFVLGVSQISFILSYFVLCFIIICVQVASVMIGIVLPYGITIEGSIFCCIILQILQGIGGFTFGLLISVVSSNAVTSFFINYSVMLMLLYMDGSGWAVEGQPRILSMITYFGPTTYPIQSLRGMMLRGWGITHNQVYPGFIVALVWICGCLLVTALVMSSKRGCRKLI